MTSSPMEAENAVVGSILIDPTCLRAVEDILRGEDFALDVNQQIYEAALRLSRADKPIDPVLIRQEILRAGGDVSDKYLLQLMEITPTAANVEAYARQTRENALGRSLMAVLTSCRDSLDRHTPVEEVLGETIQAMEELQRQESRAELVDPITGMELFYQHRIAIEQHTAHGYVSTGFRDIDNVLGGGLLASGMYVLAARPGMGKTTLALNIADRVAKNTGPVLFVSLEMDLEQLEAKRLSKECGVPSNRLLMHRLNDYESQRMAEAAMELHQLPTYIDRKDRATVADILTKARKVKNLTMVIIDYLGIITPEDRGKSASRYEYVTEISGSIKAMARRLKVPVLVLAQLNRASESRSDHRPQLSDLRDTGAIEQDADGVLFIHREGYYDGGELNRYAPEPMTIIVAKNRHGPTGKCDLAFALATSKVVAVNNDPRRVYAQSEEFKQLCMMDRERGVL